MRWRLLALVVVVIVGLASCSQLPQPQQPGPAGGSRQPPEGPGVVGDASRRAADHAGPTSVVDGAPMGYRRDAAGASAAGLAFTRLNEELVRMDDDRALAARRAMASAVTADALVEQLRTELAELRKGWPVGTLRYRVVPMAVRVTGSGPDAMRGDVWYVSVVAGRGIDTYEEWGTDTYHLVWERDDWRVAALSDVPGPRPAAGRQPTSSSAEIEARLAGFEQVAQ